MRILLSILPLTLLVSLAGAADFNGRWDITPGGNAVRAWWLEVDGASTASPSAKFVSAYSGDLNIANEVSVKGNELTFGFRYTQRKGENEHVPVHKVFRAHLDGDKLVGTMAVEGSSDAPTPWTGVRAPVIKDKDDGTWKEGKPVRLFNGKDLTGWKALESDRKFGWTVENGILKAPGGGANLVSTAKFWNFKLHIEYNVYAHSNSGVGLRGRYEIQIQDDYGKTPNSHSNGALYSRIAPSMDACKPAGEWQTYDITLIGRDLTVVLNGKTILEKKVVEGLTAMGHDPNEGLPGPLSLQGDHGPVEFRNIVLTPLTK